MKSIVQDWACHLGLRHQGVLMTAIRGCDGLEKNHVSKRIARALRGDVLNAHVGDPRKSKSFIQVFDEGTFTDMIEELTSELDVYPLHYIMHLAHAAEIIGYKHPDLNTSARWRILYFRIAKRLHLNPETEEQLDRRLNASEAEFASDGNNVNDLVLFKQCDGCGATEVSCKGARRVGFIKCCPDCSHEPRGFKLKED